MNRVRPTALPAVLLAVLLGITLSAGPAWAGPTAAAATPSRPADPYDPEAASAEADREIDTQAGEEATADGEGDAGNEPTGSSTGSDESTAGSKVPRLQQIRAQRPYRSFRRHVPAAVGPITYPIGPAASAREVWERTGKPDKLLIIRPNKIDAVARGALVAHLDRRRGTLTWQILTASLGDTWISRPEFETVRLRSTLVLTDGTRLETGTATRRLLLEGGPKAASAASLWVGPRARLNLDSLQISSWDTAAKAAVAPGAAGRPFIRVGENGLLNMTDSVVSDLGRPGEPSDGGITWGTDSGGSAIRVQVQRNHVGLKLAGSSKVDLEEVTIGRSVADGLVLEGDRDTTLRQVHSEHNGGRGVRVSGTTADRHLTGVSAAANGDYGIEATDQRGLVVEGLHVTGNRAGGLKLAGCSGCSVVGLNTRDDTIGLTVIGAAPQLKVADSQIQGGTIGVDLQGPAVLNNVAVTGVSTGVRVGTKVVAEGRAIDVLATKTGIRAQRDGAVFRLVDSRVRAPQALKGIVHRFGENVITLPPFPWLGAVGMGMLGCAILLQAVHRMRQRGQKRTSAPEHVLNIS